MYTMIWNIRNEVSYDLNLQKLAITIEDEIEGTYSRLKVLEIGVLNFDFNHDFNRKKQEKLHFFNKIFWNLYGLF